MLPGPAEAPLPAELQRMRGTLGKTMLMAIMLMQARHPGHYQSLMRVHELVQMQIHACSRLRNS